MLTAAMNRKAIVGVEFQDLNIANIHSIYADDALVLTKANMLYVMECKHILSTFGAASGLHCEWEKTKAAFIPEGPPPLAFYLLPWTWEVDANASPQLGFPVACNFSVQLMETQTQSKVEGAIEKLKKRQLTLSGRVLAANSLILSTIWYLVTLWAGDLAFLSRLQRLIEKYVWNGRSRVNRNSCTQSKSQGGLGLILIIEQMNIIRAIASNIVIWTLG